MSAPDVACDGERVDDVAERRRTDDEDVVHRDAAAAGINVRRANVRGRRPQTT
jgi:hypothetical protein